MILRTLFLSLFAFYYSAHSVAQGAFENDAILTATHRQQLGQSLSPGHCAVLFSGSFSTHGNIHDWQGSFFTDPAFFFVTGLNQPDAVMVLFHEPHVFKGKPTQAILFYPGKAIYPSILYGTSAAEDFLKSAGTSSFPVATGTLPEWESYCRDSLNSPAFAKVWVQLPSKNDAPCESVNILLRSMAPHYAFPERVENMIDEILRPNSRPEPIARRATNDISYYADLAGDPIMHEAAAIKDSAQLVSMRSRLDKIKVKFTGLETILASLRQLKSPEELEHIFQASNLAAGSVNDGMLKAKPGVKCNFIAGSMQASIGERDENATAWTRLIAGTGTAWYFQPEAGTIPVNDVAIVDAMVREEGYFARFTRTIPTSGSFTGEARKVMEQMIRAHQMVIETCRPEVLPMQIAEKGQNLLETGLKEALQINPKDQYVLINSVIYPVGLELPDPRVAGGLKVKMVVCVETTVHFLPDAKVPPSLKGRGFEIRDMVAITGEGGKLIDLTLPMDIAAIELLLKQR